jgi:flagellin-like hook-associated protein FlgL
MTTRSILGAVFGVLIPLLLAAQTSPGIDVGGKVSEAPQAVDHAADTFDSHVVRRGSTVWFGKSKNKILDYADVTAKTGIVTTDHVTGKHYEEDTTRYKLAVVVTTPDASTATAEAKMREVVRYTETSSFFDILVEAKTGVEGSSTTYLGSHKVIAATIVTTLNATAAWTMTFETGVDIGTSAGQGQGMLVNVDRSIDVIDNRSSPGDTRAASGFGIEFIENGRLLAAVGDGMYLFDRDLDPDLKLVLAAAMEVVSFRYRQ